MELCHVEFCGDLDPDAKVRCLRHQKVCFLKEDTSELGVLAWWPFVFLYGARCRKGTLRRATVSALMRPHRWRLHQTDYPGASRRSYSLEIAGGLKSILVLRHT